MARKFVVRHKDSERKEDKYTIMSVRLERALQDKLDELATKSGRSRNEIVCMALRFALDNLEFIEE